MAITKLAAAAIFFVEPEIACVSTDFIAP